MSHPFTLPEIPADLAEIIAAHRGLFGGFTMTLTPPEGGDGTTPPATPEPPAAPPAATAPVKPADITDEAWAALADPGKRAIVAERQRADTEKQRADALQKQIDDAGKTAEQKAADELKAANLRGDTAELKALKYEIAAEKGIDLKLAPRLTGATRAELEADAENLKGLLGAKPNSNPKPDDSQGKGGDGAKQTGVGAGRDLFRDTHTSSKTTT